MAFDVFISYAHADKPIADAACAALEAANIRCWIAPRDIDPGRDYGEALVDAIEGGKVFVLIFSSNANASSQIKREVERAVSKGLPIIPVRIEGVAPNRNLEYFISSPHWLDAFPPPRERYFGKLIDSVRGLLGSEVAARPTPISAPSFDRRGIVPVVAAAVALIVAAGGGYYLYGGGTQPLVRTLTGHGADADSVAFTPDGKLIAAGGWDASHSVLERRQWPTAVARHFRLSGSRGAILARWQNDRRRRADRQQCCALGCGNAPGVADPVGPHR